MGSFSNAIEQFRIKIENQLMTEQPKAIKKALNAAAQVLKDEIKPIVPTLSKSTDFRKKGTVKNNVRHRTRLFKDKSGGITIVRIRRTKGRRMASVRDNTKDRTDPFYWFMLDRGTRKMSGAHFMERAWGKGKSRAINTAKKVFISEMKKLN